jgi:hypothetical protein
MESTPEKPITNVRIKQTQSRQPSSPTMVKTEPGEELPALSTTQNRHGGRSNFSASASNVNDMDIDMDEEDPEYIRAQIEVDEAQARAAKRRMKLMEIERRNHRLS